MHTILHGLICDLGVAGESWEYHEAPRLGEEKTQLNRKASVGAFLHLASFWCFVLWTFWYAFHKLPVFEPLLLCIEDFKEGGVGEGIFKCSSQKYDRSNWLKIDLTSLTELGKQTIKPENKMAWHFGDSG